MKILHLVQSFGRGGRRQAIQTLMHGLGRLGVSSELCLLNELGCPVGEAVHVSTKINILGRRGGIDGRAIRRLARICRDRGTDILHVHDGASQLAGALTRLRRPRTRLVMTFHRSLGFESARPRDRLRNALAGALTAAVVTASCERRMHYLSENFVASRKVVRIPLGIELARFEPKPRRRANARAALGIEPDGIVLGAVGHFGAEKGLDRSLRVLQVLARRGLPHPVTLIVVGDGAPADRRALQKLAQETPTVRVVFTGFHPRVERWLQACDIFVHLPRQEAFGLAVVEAMAMGLPIVACRVGGLTDIVREGVNGWLVRPGTPADMTGALELLILSSRIRTEMGIESRRIARAEFGADLYSQRYVGLYDDILQGNRPRGVESSNEGREADGCGRRALLGRWWRRNDPHSNPPSQGRRKPESSAVGRVATCRLLTPRPSSPPQGGRELEEEGTQGPPRQGAGNQGGE